MLACLALGNVSIVICTISPAYNDLTCDWQVWFSSCSSSRLIRRSLKRKCSPEADARLLAHSSWIQPMLVLEFLTVSSLPG
ncbi:hypothetical protein ATANTOWER_017535 [Ataeniobius toweri]|uniref:Secreted protein n=1 Tax=Ataeniobius toweri TaxID=208326 RepID=A0ABU7A6W0_9TELE|nr:hypothetical protein [Ataeniobius toweri]